MNVLIWIQISKSGEKLLLKEILPKVVTTRTLITKKWRREDDKSLFVHKCIVYVNVSGNLISFENYGSWIEKLKINQHINAVR